MTDTQHYEQQISSDGEELITKSFSKEAALISEKRLPILHPLKYPCICPILAVFNTHATGYFSSVAKLSLDKASVSKNYRFTHSEDS
mmetsp:Transcript_34764/g.84275  ORF Transcript_34764/g.84275 Transcript_34764/m.84275 type:complete len:87 (-) Transcript_34764:123-383(-)